MNHVEKRRSDEQLLGKCWRDSQPGPVLKEVSKSLPLTPELPFPALQFPCGFLPTFSISVLNRNEMFVAEHL